MQEPQQSRILVGVAPRRGHDAALEYAAAEGARRGIDLHLVLVVHPHGPGPDGPVDGAVNGDERRDTDIQLLQCEERVAAWTDGLVAVTTEVAHGGVVPSLVAASRDAELVVLQHHLTSWPRHLPTRSITNGVATRVGAPVVAVPDGWREWSPRWATGRGGDRERCALVAGRRAGPGARASYGKRGPAHAGLVVRRRPRGRRPDLPDRHRRGVGAASPGESREGVRRPDGCLPGRVDQDRRRPRSGGVRADPGGRPVATARHGASRTVFARRRPPRPGHTGRPRARPVPGRGRRHAATGAVRAIVPANDDRWPGPGSAVPAHHGGEDTRPRGDGDERADHESTAPSWSESTDRSAASPGCGTPPTRRSASGSVSTSSTSRPATCRKGRSCSSPTDPCKASPPGCSNAAPCVANEVAPDVDVATHHLTGHRIPEMVGFADDAALLVLGARHLTVMDRVWTGATVAGAVSRADVPDGGRPGGPGSRRRHATGSSSATSRSSTPTELLTAAFALADGLGAELEVLHAWKLQGLYDDMIASSTEEEADERPGAGPDRAAARRPPCAPTPT